MFVVYCRLVQPWTAWMDGKPGWCEVPCYLVIFKSQAACTFQVMCKHIIAKMRYISHGYYKGLQWQK